MTKKDFIELNNLRKELKMWNEYKEHLENKTLNKNGTEHVAIQFRETDEILDRIIAKLQKKINECMGFIEEVDDSFLRQIFFYKYVKGETWVKTSFLLGSSEDSIRQRANRYFNKYLPQK